MYAEVYSGGSPSSCWAYAEAYAGDLCIKQVPFLLFQETFKLVAPEMETMEVPPKVGSD